MTPTDKLNRLLARCKCGVHLTVNDHRNVYNTAEQWLDELESRRESHPHLDPDVRARIIELNQVVELQFYPDTPVGSYLIVHHDLDAALGEALACLEST